VLKNEGDGDSQIKPLPEDASGPRENRLLARLPQHEYDRLAPLLTEVSFGFKESLFESGQRLDSVYFPVSGVFSFLAELSGKKRVAVYLGGNEGLVGLPVLLGIDRSPVRALAQAPGRAWRMNVDDLNEEVKRGGALKDLLFQHAGHILTRLVQSVACAGSHPLDKRCCRWLLMLHDRVRESQFQLTQVDLAEMLGARRASVTEIAGALQKAGLIHYTRGRITILDRKALENAACECYRLDRL
jgi:CRP-like cAMP-binding protein